MIPMLTGWGYWRPIGFPRVYGFVIARTGGFAMRSWPEAPEESVAVRAYWWPWSEAW